MSLIPISELPRTDQTTHDLIFRNLLPREVQDDSDELVVEKGEEEVVACATEVIPCPVELPPQLTQEFIEQFNIKCVVAIRPGSGNSMKAVLLKNIRGVAICRTHAHKKFLHKNLIEFTQSQRLANLADGAPTKSEKIVAYEKNLVKDDLWPSVVPKAATTVPPLTTADGTTNASASSTAPQGNHSPTCGKAAAIPVTPAVAKVSSIPAPSPQANVAVAAFGSNTL